jgi:hypothetical protein
VEQEKTKKRFKTRNVVSTPGSEEGKYSSGTEAAPYSCLSKTRAAESA